MSFESRRNAFFDPGRTRLVFRCVLGRYVVSSLISTQTFRRALTASVDSCAEIECPFSGVTNSGRVWRKVPESDARSVDWQLNAQHDSSISFKPIASD